MNKTRILAVLALSIIFLLQVTTVHAAWTTPPVILRVSDAVRAGRSFSINGEGINSNANLDVALALDATGTLPATPPVGALRSSIIQTDAHRHYLVATMPVTAAPGIYNVWVKNELGWSAPYKMNAARALFMSDYQAHNGTDIEVVGRNFDQAEFGGATHTMVRLNDGGKTTCTMPIKNLNPFHVTFTVGTQNLGTYFVEVSNDGGVHWSRLTSGQTLSIIATTGTDPLGLGVSWAQDFKWSSIYDVTKYGATGNDTNDDTVAMQKAIDAAEKAGGGVVYLPNGSYYINSLNLGAGVVLEGQDEYNTKLYYRGTAGSMINSKTANAVGGVAKLQGVARLSILLADTSINGRPDLFLTWAMVGVPSAIRNCGRPTESSSPMSIWNIRTPPATSRLRIAGSAGSPS